MAGALDGVRVLEVAAWTFVPAAGAVLADWGADVIKVEHPVTGDPQRGLRTMGLLPGGESAVNFIIEQPNRGKRSIGLDIASEHGHALLAAKLVERSDVFLTSFLPAVRQRLRIDIEHIRAINPDIVYARGTGQGSRGPDAGKGGYDGASYWGRGGVADALTPACAEFPIGGRPAFGDLAGGMTIAGGIAAALFQRERTGVAPVVDVSLLGMAMWMLSPDIVASGLYGGEPMGKFDGRSPMPLVGPYKTKDDRYLTLMLLQGDRFWPELCEHIGRPDLATDERYTTDLARMTNGAEVFALLDEAFASRTLEEWKDTLATMTGVWAPVQSASELVDDPQVRANGYLTNVHVDGTDFDLVASPVQLDETPVPLTPAPEHGQHTEEILLELGIDWDEIAQGKDSGAIL